jgi:hypothetical protein
MEGVQIELRNIILNFGASDLHADVEQNSTSHTLKDFFTSVG